MKDCLYHRLDSHLLFMKESNNKQTVTTNPSLTYTHKDLRDVYVTVDSMDLTGNINTTGPKYKQSEHSLGT